MTRKSILRTAEKMICGERQHDYGTPEDSFARIAHYWNEYLDTKPHASLTSFDVAVMMCLFKIARINHGQATEDTMVDLVGYAAIAGSLVPKIMSPEEIARMIADSPTQEDIDNMMSDEDNVCECED